jgi:NTE family protein
VSDVVALLAGLPLFAGYSAAELERIGTRCSDRRYERGATVWRAGDAGTDLLVIAQGALTVHGAGGEIVAHLGPGDAVGELGLLLGEPRSATVTAARPTRVFAMQAADFNRFVADDARALDAVGEMLARRLRRRAPISAPARHGVVVAVVAPASSPVISIVTYALRDLIANDTGLPVLHADTEDLATYSGDRGAITVDALRQFLEGNRFPVVVVDLPAEAGVRSFEVARHADVVVEIDGTTARAGAPHGTRVLPLYLDSRPDSSHGDTAPFVLHLGPELLRLEPRAAARAIVDAPSSPAARVLGRLSRTVQRRVVGVALGGRAAFGLSGIGVLRALEHSGVPVDVVAGSSIGAVVAVASAAGARAEELERTAQSLSSLLRLWRTVDVAATGDALLGGRQLMHYLRAFYVGVGTFDDLILPARVVATDLANGERFVMGEGSIERAVRASIGMPPFLAPVIDDGRTLVDGSIVDPVPCDVARELGADIVIGVSATPRPNAGSATMLTRVSRGLNRLNPLAYFGGRLRGLNLLDAVMSSFQVAEHELGHYLARAADVVVEPDLSAHTWIELYRAPEIVARGADAGTAAIPEIERVLADRLTGFAPDHASGFTTNGAAPAATVLPAEGVTTPSDDAPEAAAAGSRWSPVP